MCDSSPLQSHGRIRRFLLITVLVVAAYAGGALTTHAVHASSQRESPYAQLSQMARALVFIENHYVDPVERQRILDGAVTGMVAELDPHSAYMNPKDFALFNEDTEGAFGGIGVEVDFKNEQVIVIAPIPDTPAQRAGIKAGDRIVAVGNKPLSRLSIDKIVRLMRGPVKTKVKVAIKRKGVDDLMHFELVREHIKVKSVEHKRLVKAIGYIRLKQFQQGTHRELLQAVAKLKAEGTLAGVIIDLRNNPGGLINEAEGVADELMSGGVIFSTRHRGEVLDEVHARAGGSLAQVPAVVLVNEFSASSAELVAGALQDHQRATIIGAPTFGKGSVQTIFQLQGGAGLRLTTMRYYTPKGRAIQAAGIAPDVVIKYADSSADDALIMREASLEGHLAAEAQNRDKAAAKVLKGTRTPEYKPVDKLPSDPSAGADFALRVAHETLTGT